ncbi:hypothetical protein J3L16_10850 [Alteromonas sp. 5E99-2]|uniref:hypothetical protein n=1 Tax=Alteromonas sp. 5E99-2 TaxID=2817683 RepID=UPI001A98E26F|nr:hypothetical protein [Alteromonas sp. 5E99-2]MBO1256182.1 hypothetical protein [Alteromonas sp. 5E99-2]
MKHQETLIVAQVIQHSEKLNAKRHIIPAHMQDKWQSLMKQVDSLKPSINPITMRKSVSFQGTLDDLNALLLALSTMNRLVNN